ncbi:hypothetical protein [Nocardia farcinica]|uniref:hypothetical protein n=1 Tax=Nocardia farcinica TaxID=37329 RepID=UPI002456A6DF|nr:hypothetical protein [Nocardia farcinica]
MRAHPTAFGWIALEVSRWPEGDKAAIRRLARHLGYRLYWPRPSVLPLIDQIRSADVDAVLTPSPAHLDMIQLNAIMSIADVETLHPRLSFARWATPHGQR